VFVPCDDEVSADRFGTFEHTIVGFISQEMKMRFGDYRIIYWVYAEIKHIKIYD